MGNLYAGVAGSFQNYWKTYGGWAAMLRSPYLHLSVVLALLLRPLWCRSSTELYDLTISIVPSVLGFSLGGYAILLAFGDDEFRRRISGRECGGEPSPFMGANSAFIHFIVVSTAALLLSLVGKARDPGALYCAVSCVALIYSIACALASAFAIYKVAGWYDTHAENQKRRENGTTGTPGF